MIRTSPWPWLVLALAGATPALSQQQITGLPSFGLTPPQVQPGIDQREVDLSVEGTYDSDAAKSGAAVAAARGLKLSDYIVHPELGVTLSKPLGLQTVFLQGVVGYNRYIRNPILDRSNVDVDAGVLGRLGFCQSTLSGGYTRQQLQLSDIGLLTSTGALQTNPSDVIQDGVVAFTGTCGHAVGLAPTVSASETFIQNSQAQLQSVNARSFSTSDGLTYKLPALGAVSLLGQFTDTRYPDRAGALPGTTVSLGFTTVGGGVSFSRAVGSRLQSDLSLNYVQSESSLGGGGGFTGLTYSAGVTYTPTSRLTASIEAYKGVQPSNIPGALFVVDQFVSLTASYALGARSDVHATFTRLAQAYRGLTLSSALEITDNRRTDVGAGWRLRLTRRLSLSADIDYERRAANVVGLSYSDVIVGLTAAVKFD